MLLPLRTIEALLMDPRSACTLAWRRILANKNWHESKVIISVPDLFSDRSQLATLGLSPLHRAYLGISGATFEEVLTSTPRSAIDQVDGTSRTTLSWACGRGDCYTAVKLLACGADPNKPDISGRTPLHWSTYAKGSCCTSLLLAAKADVDQKTHFGRTAFSMLACACLSEFSSLKFFQTFTAYGADLECVDNTGRTPLIITASLDRSSLLSYLLKHGVDVNARSKGGATALSLAVFNNSHRSLPILLQNPALDYTGRYVYGYTLLHQAAHYADIETLELLQRAKLGRLDVEATHGTFAAQQCAQRRRDRNGQWMEWALRPRDKDPVEWYKAFEALLKSVHDAKRELGKSSGDGHNPGEGSSARDDYTQVPEEVWEDAPESPLERQP